MEELDLRLNFEMIHSRALDDPGLGIDCLEIGTEISTGPILVGADSNGARYLLLPLHENEAFEEDRQSSAVHLIEITHDGMTYIAARCNNPNLNNVFTYFSLALLDHVTHGETSPSRAAIITLNQWRKLLEDAPDPLMLSENKTIGLLAELLFLEEILKKQHHLNTDIWTGPSRSQHDFRCGCISIEVKASKLREGREISISSLAQLTPPVEGDLYLAFYRFESAPNGESISAVVERILNLGIAPQTLIQELHKVGYTLDDDPLVAENTYLLTEHRIYDTQSDSFPKITPESFKEDECPPGVLSLSYKIDLTNEPPSPLSEEDRTQLITDCASS